MLGKKVPQGRLGLLSGQALLLRLPPDWAWRVNCRDFFVRTNLAHGSGLANVAVNKWSLVNSGFEWSGVFINHLISPFRGMFLFRGPVTRQLIWVASAPGLQWGEVRSMTPCLSLFIARSVDWAAAAISRPACHALRGDFGTRCGNGGKPHNRQLPPAKRTPGSLSEGTLIWLGLVGFGCSQLIKKLGKLLSVRVHRVNFSHQIVQGLPAPFSLVCKFSLGFHKVRKPRVLTVN